MEGLSVGATERNSYNREREKSKVAKRNRGKNGNGGEGAKRRGRTKLGMRKEGRRKVKREKKGNDNWREGVEGKAYTWYVEKKGEMTRSRGNFKLKK